MTENGNDLPGISFSTFILSLASSAMVQLGEVPNPETGKTERNILMARHSIDLLTMLEDKTKNGLTSEEEKLLRDVIYELRVKFVANS